MLGSTSSTTEQIVQNTQSTFERLIANTFNWRTFLVFALAFILAWLASRMVASILLKIARVLSKRGDKARTSEKALQFRRLETYLSIAVALIRAAIFAIAIFIAWSATHSPSGNQAAIIGASTIFVVLGGATLAPMLRDLTAGSLMIAERWYNVGDFITIDPYYEESGVVERMNLRSTRVRKINGEVMWIHNQYIQRVSVSPNGVRTMALDLFVNDKEKGEQIVNHLKSVLTVGPIMLIRPLEVAYTQKLSDDLWEITIIGQTTPGREWLLETFAVSLVKDYDKKNNGKNGAIAYEPLVRYADPVVENKFKRAVRIHSEEAKKSGRLALLAAGTQSIYRKTAKATRKQPTKTKQPSSKKSKA
jgi:small-conductance mechanosensitive channel